MNLEDPTAETRRRLRSFKLHLLIFLVVMVVLVPLNYIFEPERPWFLLPLLGWTGVLAVHVAWVMRLFGR